MGGLYHHLSPALQTLALNPEGIQYYAHSVIKSEIFQVTRRNDPDCYLHVIAFIADQYFRIQDNPVDVLLEFNRYAGSGPSKLTWLIVEECFGKEDLSIATRRIFREAASFQQTLWGSNCETHSNLIEF